MDTYEEAQAVTQLREKIHTYATSAVAYGNVDRGWVNQRINRMGAKLVNTPATYRLNVPITGSYALTVNAQSRTAALKYFNELVQKAADAGELRGATLHSAFIVDFKVVGDPVFFSGPEDVLPAEDTITDLATLKTAIRAMLMAGVVEQGWGYSYARTAAEDMGIDPLPEMTNKVVQVPVSGFTTVTVPSFEGETDGEALARATAAQISRAGKVWVEPEELGEPVPARDQDSGFTLIDDEDVDF